MSQFRNFYRCAHCAHAWTDDWSAQCDDDCPRCGARHMSPYQSEELKETDDERRERITQLNDEFRTTFRGGRIMMTPGVDELPACVRAHALMMVAKYEGFTPDNDPYGEHDFGSFELVGRKFFWKIDYYDKAMEYGSDDPTVPDKTSRVLTLMLASEY